MRGRTARSLGVWRFGGLEAWGLGGWEVGRLGGLGGWVVGGYEVGGWEVGKLGCVNTGMWLCVSFLYAVVAGPWPLVTEMLASELWASSPCLVYLIRR